MSLLPEEFYEQERQSVDAKRFEVGALLKKTRERYNISLQEVSEYLNIRQGLLQALEDGNVAELPAQVYVIGFLKSYASYLNLDVDKTVLQYKKETGLTQEKVQLDVPVTPQPLQLPDKKVIMGVLGGVIVILLVLWGFSDNDKQSAINQTPDLEESIDVSSLKMEPLSQLPEVSTDLKMQMPKSSSSAQALPVVKEPVVEQKSVNDRIVQANSDLKVSSRATIYGAANVNARVVLKAIKNSWVEIKDDSGRVLLSRVLKPEDVFYVPVDGGAYLTTGNAGGLEIYVDKTYAGVAGDAAEVLKNYKITPQGLIKQ